MRQIKPVLLSLVLSISCGAAAWAQTKGAPNMDDSVISMRVKSALIANDSTKANQINVETQRGIVQLSGFVDSEAMRAAAASTAKNVTGVKEVQNKLMIRDANRSPGQAVDDTAIAAKVKGEIAGKSGLNTATQVTVEVNSGIVELSGFVATADEKAKAAQVARGVSGVKDVHNNISLRPQG
jgi:hyperosmotically inducible periplasmic protein